jgi:hypothetical protein
MCIELPILGVGRLLMVRIKVVWSCPTTDWSGKLTGQRLDLQGDCTTT